MFKNATIYRISSSAQVALEQLDADLQCNAFAPCTPSQEFSSGWVPPRGEEHGALVENVGGQRILTLMTETKAVPSGIIKLKLAEKSKEIEAETGRKPTKTEIKEIKEELKFTLLKSAFPKRGSVMVWLDVKNGLAVIDTSSAARASDVATELLQTGYFVLAPLVTAMEASLAMAGWLLSQEPPVGFAVDRACELKALDGTKAVVKYADHALNIEEVCMHVRNGKTPVQLALTWQDKVSFDLTNTLVLKRLSFNDVKLKDHASRSESSSFDADVAIATGELSSLIPDLIAALGGEREKGEPVKSVASTRETVASDAAPLLATA